MVNGRTWAEGHDWDEKYFCVNCFQKKFEAIQRKYKRMEEDLQWLSKNGNPNSKQLLVIKHALAFDPLSE